MITCNKIPIRQEWAQNNSLDSIIDIKGNLRSMNEVDCSRKPFEYEYSELKQVVNDFLDIYLGSRLGANRREVITNTLRNENYNIYGRIVTKRKKGCSYYYSLLNAHAKGDGWVHCSIKMESEACNEGLNWECDELDILARARQVYRTPYFNRLKQFFIRLLEIICK